MNLDLPGGCPPQINHNTLICLCLNSINIKLLPACVLICAGPTPPVVFAVRPWVSWHGFHSGWRPHQRVWTQLWYSPLGFTPSGPRTGFQTQLNPPLSLSLSTYIIYKLIKKRVRVWGFEILVIFHLRIRWEYDGKLMWQLRVRGFKECGTHGLTKL